jgi:putative transcriptional regulator
MKPRHHPDDATILAYAAGAVTEGFSLIIAAHLAWCGRCRGRLVEAEHLGGMLIERLETAPLRDGSFDEVWARVAANAPETPRPAAGLPATRDIPEVLAPWLPDGLDCVRWRSVLPGVRQFPLSGIASERGAVRLLSIAPGTTIPHHGHRGSELTLVLRGSYADEIGRFGPGDLADLDPDVQHQPIADTAEPCICIVATDAPLRFGNLLGRVVQPLLGF